MAFITREDGTRFVIPSYREILAIKKPSLLKREILLLSANYGEYITLQKKNNDHYEAAFSPDWGYLLGETVWYHFEKPQDLIYCEAIPDTSEVILVVVKNGSVYLDGTFSLDSIPDELVIFKTQQAEFDIYIYGDVPISKTEEEGKFSFDRSSIKSFTMLDAPAFPLLPLIKVYQLQLVDVVLKSKGIGVFPLKPLLALLLLLTLGWVAFNYLTSEAPQIEEVFVPVINPYQLYQQALMSPEPMQEIHWLSNTIINLNSIPGWVPDSITYSGASAQASVKSLGAKTNILFDWATKNGAAVEIKPEGFFINLSTQFQNRPNPLSNISDLNQVISRLIDGVSSVLPGNNFDVGIIRPKGKYSEREVKITFINISPATLDLLGQQLKDLPLVLNSTSIKVVNGYLSGTITLTALGN